MLALGRIEPAATTLKANANANSQGSRRLRGNLPSSAYPSWRERVTPSVPPSLVASDSRPQIAVSSSRIEVAMIGWKSLALLGFGFLTIACAALSRIDVLA